MKGQIEELQNDITECYGCDPMYYGTDGDFLAKGLVEMGWRKQEWISVEDKFPDVDKILGWDGTAMWFFDAKGICESLQNVISKNGITHWLPIPKPPKMKGVE